MDRTGSFGRCRPRHPAAAPRGRQTAAAAAFGSADARTASRADRRMGRSADTDRDWWSWPSRSAYSPYMCFSDNSPKSCPVGVRRDVIARTPDPRQRCRLRCLLTLAAALAVGSGQSALAAATAWVGDDHASARLITAVEAVGSGSTVDAGLEIRSGAGLARLLALAGRCRGRAEHRLGGVEQPRACRDRLAGADPPLAAGLRDRRLR